MPRKARIKTESPQDAPVEAKPRKLPRISVLERRLQNPFGDGSPQIRLKEPGWEVHVVNGALRPGRYHDVTRNKGWVPVEPDEIDGEAEDFGFDVKEGRVVRGERGQEVLMKMPAADYKAIQQAKDAHNKAANTGARLKAGIVSATGATHGDQAADLVNRSITIREERAPVPLDEPGT
jgi:hypothetical protein